MTKTVNSIVLKEGRVLLTKRNHQWEFPGRELKENEEALKVAHDNIKNIFPNVEITDLVYYGLFKDYSGDHGKKVKIESYIVELNNVDAFPEEDKLNYRYSPLVTIPNLNMSSLNSEIMVSLAKKGYLALID